MPMLTQALWMLVAALAVAITATGFNCLQARDEAEKALREEIARNRALASESGALRLEIRKLRAMQARLGVGTNALGQAANIEPEETH